MSENAKDESGTQEHQAPAGAEIEASWGRGRSAIPYTATAKWIVLRKKEKPVGGDLLRLVRRRRARPRSAGHVRLQRRAGRLVGVPAHGRGRAAAGRVPGGRHAPDDAAAAGRERVVVARVHRPRLRRSGRHRLQPHRSSRETRRATGKDGAKPDDARRPEGVLRLQARPRVAVRVHGPLALRATAAGARPSSSPARATAATASAASCACCRRRPGSA